jgi:putative glycosyl hydrolase-like family 6 (GHL6) protein/glycosyl hydrolase family 42 (putative beta-galactosidase)
MASKVFLCKSHPDFHIPEDADVGEGFDGDAYAKRLAECGVDAVAFFAKCHYGHSYYDTKVGFRHPRLKKDMLRELTDGCRKHGVGVVAYYSVFLDTAAVRRHPEWGLQATSHKTDAGFDSGNYLPVCVNSPYGRELLIPQSVEVVTDYDVDELFYDTMTGFSPCYCPTCRDLFGHDIPEGPDDSHWLEYVRWYAEQFDTFFVDVAKAVHEANPDVAVTFNWKWGIREPTPPPPQIDRLGADLIPTGTVASMQCRYFAGTDMPFDYMTGRFLHGLGDWNSNTRESILYTAACSVANGGGFYIIDRQLPDGSLEERAYEMMADVFGFLQARRPWLVDTRHVPEIGVLYAYSHVMGKEMEFFPDPGVRKERMKSFEGIVRLFMEHARHFTALSAETLQKRIGEYRLIVVGEQEFLDDATKRALTDYVRDGGNLLITQSGDEAGVDKDLLDLAGVEYQRHGELPYGYLGATPPIVMRGRFAQVTPGADVETLCPAIEPMHAGAGGNKFGHGFAPPTEPTGHPAVTLRNVGRGQVIYVAAPVCKSYLDHQNPALAQLVLDLVDRLLPDPIARTSTRAQVEMSLVRKGDDLIVHLVNHSGRERLGGYHYPVTEYIPEIREIGVAVKAPSRPVKVLSVPDPRELAIEERDGYLHFTSPPLHAMQSFALEGYFAGDSA